MSDESTKAALTAFVLAVGTGIIVLGVCFGVLSLAWDPNPTQLLSFLSGLFIGIGALSLEQMRRWPK